MDLQGIEPDPVDIASAREWFGGCGYTAEEMYQIAQCEKIVRLSGTRDRQGKSPQNGNGRRARRNAHLR